MISPDVLDRIREEVERIERMLSSEEGCSEGITDICVKKLFGLCSCDGRRECYEPADEMDEMVYRALKEFEGHVSREVVERAKRMWVERDRYLINPVDIALRLISIAGREIEGKKRVKPCDWVVFI